MKNVLRILAIMSLAMLLPLALMGCNGDTEEETNNATRDAEVIETETEAPVVEDQANLWEGDMPKVKIEIEDFGDVVVELNPEIAPISVANFLKLVNEGFYDGVGFHRIIEGFMIQGGDPDGTGMGGSDENIQGEFANNGVDNPISHDRGVLSMARSSDPNSASSQFFIVHQDAHFLNGDYAAFGRVVEGMDVVDAIAENTPVTDGNGSVAPENHPVMTRVTVVD
ncbi:MAG: peptidylprolyl isomerase [Coriobacteriia bacterium]|nr:peptidylprolyl isomerase [Coriobacteriia bacterium]